MVHLLLPSPSLAALEALELILTPDALNLTSAAAATVRPFTKHVIENQETKAQCAYASTVSM
jgi:hypothetical protein